MAAVTINNGIPNVCAIEGQPFSFEIPSDAFNGSNLVYTAEILRINPDYGGTPILPSVNGEWWHMRQLGTKYNWVSLSNGTFSGTPSNTAFNRWWNDDSIQVIVRATDLTDGQYAEEVFYITMHEYAVGVTPTPMAKLEADCAYVIDTAGGHTIDTVALGLNAGDTIGIKAGVTLDFLNIKMNSGIIGNPIYLTNVGGKGTIGATQSNTCWSQGQYYKFLGQGTVDDPYGFDITGTSNPGIQVINSYHDTEHAFLEIHDTGFTGMSVKSQYVQRPMLSIDDQVKYNGNDPSSEEEMNLIPAVRLNWCVRTDLEADASIDAAYTKRFYDGSNWVDVPFTQIENGANLGRVNFSDLNTLNPNVGDWVYSPDVDFFHIYNVCEDWVVWYDMVHTRIHDCYAHDIGTSGGVLPSADSDGENMYAGFGQYENDHDESSSTDFFPNGPHDLRDFNMHHFYGKKNGYDAFQFKNMPHNDSFIHHNFGHEYGLGKNIDWNIGIQDEGVNVGEGYSGWFAYNIVRTCGEVSPNGYQNYSSNNTIAAFNVFHNDLHYGKVPFWGRKEGLLGGTDPSQLHNNGFFNTAIKFDGLGEQFGADPIPERQDDLIDMISFMENKEWANNLFYDVPFLTRLSGLTLNEQNIIFDGAFEDLDNGNYNPVSGNAMSGGFDVKLQDWGPLDFSDSGDPELYDLYGNQLDWANLKIGAVQASPSVDSSYPTTDPHPVDGLREEDENIIETVLHTTNNWASNLKSTTFFTSVKSFGSYVYYIYCDHEFRPKLVKSNKAGTVVTEAYLDNGADYVVKNDAHNAFSIGIDKDGYIHVVGDMHQYFHVRLDGQSDRIPRYDGSNILYWKSTSPQDITDFTFMGYEADGVKPDGYSWSYCKFLNDNNGDLFLSARIYVHDQGHWEGETGLGLYAYDTVTETWTTRGSLAPTTHGNVAIHKCIFWEDNGDLAQHPDYDVDNANYQSFYNGMYFDQDNILHCSYGINNLSTNKDNTDIIYFKSVDGGVTFQKADGTVLNTPVRGSGSPDSGDIMTTGRQAGHSFTGVDFLGNPISLYSPYLDQTEISPERPVTRLWNGSTWGAEINTPNSVYGYGTFIGMGSDFILTYFAGGTSTSNRIHRSYRYGEFGYYYTMGGEISGVDFTRWNQADELFYVINNGVNQTLKKITFNEVEPVASGRKQGARALLF